MIDLHCHLLPGIDDGPTTIDESLELAKFAVQNGITHAVVTPHIHAGRYPNQRDNIAQATTHFREQLKSHQVPLTLSYAAEVRIGPEIMEMVANQQIPFIGRQGDFDILLLEFPHEGILVGSENLTAWLLKRKIRPLIAHPERNKMVMRDVELIAPFVAQGCLLQVTASSVAGYFGKAAQQTARILLERNWVYAIATDAHNLKYRPPDLAAGRDAAATLVGTERAEQLVKHNPAALLVAS
ncbi:MAG: tyrosine-protein phosphatase [bacterium]